MRKVITRFALLVLLPFMFLYGPVASAKSTAPQAAPAQESTLAQVDEGSSISTLPLAFKGVAKAGGIVPFAKTPTEFDPAMPSAEARAEFPDTAFGTGYVFNPGLVLRASFATSGGIRVPTEVACSQPGGREKEEFNSGEKMEWNGQIRLGGGAVKASCADGPATVTSGYLYNVVFVTAPASQGAEPPGQVAVVAVGFVSVVTSSVMRSDGLAVDVVTELKDVNIGALGQVHFDSIKVEASALTSDGSTAEATTRISYLGGRVGANDCSVGGTCRFVIGSQVEEQETPDPKPFIDAASAALAPSGLSISASESVTSTATDNTSAEARATGLTIRGASTDERNASVYGERSFSIALGWTSALSHLTPNPAADTGVAPPSFEAPTTEEPTFFEAPSLAPQLPDAPTPAVQVAGGSFKIGLDWSSFRIKGLPWEQSLAAWGGIGVIGGGMMLIRRRLFSV